MDENGGSKILTGIQQIVKLKEILQKWQSSSVNLINSPEAINSQSNPNNTGGISPVTITNNKRLRIVRSDSDEDGGGCCHSPEPPHDVPEGYLAVYVGPELRRFIIPTSYLTHSLFKVLLEKAEEEFGFVHSGALTIPCEIETFKYLIKCIERHHKDQSNDTSAEASLTIEE